MKAKHKSPGEAFQNTGPNTSYPLRQTKSNTKTYIELMSDLLLPLLSTVTLTVPLHEIIYLW